MKTNIHTIIEMLHSDPAGISLKFGIPLRTVYSWYRGERVPADYVICMMLNIILLERRMSDAKRSEGLGIGMEEDSSGIKEACKTSESEAGET